MQVDLICKSRLYKNILDIQNKPLRKSSLFNQLICKSLNYMQKSIMLKKKTIQKFRIKVALMYAKKCFHEFLLNHSLP